MTPRFSAYPPWKAPTRDAEALIWPDPPVLLNQTLENHRRLGGDDRALVQGIALSELRQRQRQAIHVDDGQPLIATGHQTELIHPGVWAKNALLHAASAKIGAKSIHFSVDTDAPKHLHLRWPGGAVAITDDPRLTTAPWSGLLDGPTPAHVRDTAHRFSAASNPWTFRPMAGEFLSELGRLSQTPGKLPAMLVAALNRLDESLGLHRQMLTTSPLWSGEPYLVFAYHLLARAEKFAKIYNGALAEYRVAHRLRTAARPMPDLLLNEHQCETAFWLDDLAAQTRSRPSVQRYDGGWKLAIAGDELILRESTEGWKGAAQLQAFLQQHNVRLSPRALTLTAFIRLLIADQFVHGIGGGRYDQVTDLVLDRFFGVEPPKFSVTTTTLYFPAAVGRTRACLPCLLHEGHHLRHQLLGDQKMMMIRQIEELPRRSFQRQRIFSQMHDQLATALISHPSMKQWEQQIAQATSQDQEEQSLFDRELFYAVQPRDRLELVIERYRTAFDG